MEQKRIINFSIILLLTISLVVSILLNFHFQMSGHESVEKANNLDVPDKVYMENLTSFFGEKLSSNGVTNIKLIRDRNSGKYKLSFSMPKIKPKDVIWIGIDHGELPFDLEISTAGRIFGYFEKSSQSESAAVVDSTASDHLRRIHNASARIIQAEKNLYRSSGISN